MIVKSSFSAERALLAQKCADYLQLKDIPSAFYEIGVNVSELPVDISQDESPSIPESSLLSMGLVYSYNGTLTFISRNGHTMILPDCEFVKEKLQELGYLICARGESSPATIDYDVREQYTLPKELVQKIWEQERGPHPDKMDEYPYDVFANKYYRGGLLVSDQATEIALRSDLTNQTIRKIISLDRLSQPALDVETFEDYMTYVRRNSMINDELYYSTNGLYNIYRERQLLDLENRKYTAMLANRSFESGLDDNGNLTDVASEIRRK